MIYNLIKKNQYFDSVTLMLFSSKLSSIDGVIQAAVMMGTDHNKQLMTDSKTLDPKYLPDITANDLIIGINAKDQSAIDEAIRVLDEQFANKVDSNKEGTTRAKNLDLALKEAPNSNIAVISIPGRFARSEAMKALKKGLHVMLFSDNVPIDDEIALKEYAYKNDLLMMGPDCGTTIINGVALGFSNVVRKGNIGLTAASGTGLQEVSVIIDKLGAGISQGLGTGGRDLSERVGGITMLQTLDALNNDPNTEVIGIISKPPHPSVMEKIIKKASTIKKPIVACFLGADLNIFNNTNIIGTSTLESAAYTLVKLANNEKVDDVKNSPLYFDTKSWLENILPSKGKYIRALYSGGTLAFESLLLLNKFLPNLYSNIALDKKYNLDNPIESKEHTVLDMGEDFFTDGSPHPMIDPDQRANRIVKDGLDKDTSVVLFDCVLGYGSTDYAAEAISKAINKVKEKRDDVVFIGSITGTNGDPQSLTLAEQTLKNAGAYVLPTNAQAAKFAFDVLKKRGL